MRRVLLAATGVLVTVAAFGANAVRCEQGSIHEAAGAGDLATVRALVAKSPDLANAKDESGRTPLHWAARGTNAELLAYLVEKGADVNALDNNGTAPLHSVASRGNVDGIRILLAEGADIHLETAEKNTSLHLAAQAGQTEAVRLLVGRGAGLERVNGYGRTPLVLAARERGGAAVIEALLDSDAKVDAVDRFGDTALALAAWRGTADVVTLLMKRNAAVPVTGEKGVQLLRWAVSKALPDLFAYMVGKGADLTIEQGGRTLLHAAAEGESVPIVETLLSKRLDINRKDANGWTPLLFAVDAGRTAVVDLLLAKGADKHVRTSIGQSAYNVAEDDDDRTMMTFLAARAFDRGPAQFPELGGPYLGQKTPGKTSEVFAPGLVSGRYSLHGNVVFTPDGKEALWSLMGGRAVVSRLIDGRWTYPRKVSYGGTALEDVPFYHPDGTRLYDMARRPFPGGRDRQKENIWVWDKSPDGWTNPRPLAGEINDLPQHWQFSVDRAGHVYFATTVSGSSGADIYVSRLVNGCYAKPENLGPAINTTAEDEFPHVSPDGSYLLFGRDEDVYVSFRQPDGRWGEARPLGPEVNTPGMELLPRVSPDGRHLFYFGEGGVRWIDASVIQDARRRDAR
jgi:ankyrin repeat protein